MPIYEYACDGCRNEFEVLVRGSEAVACPECGGEKLVKQFSVPAAHTKGEALPIQGSMPAGGCGRPICGTGGCQMM